MADPIEIPRELPMASLSILLKFARGVKTWSPEVAAAALTLVAYGYGLSIGQPPVVGELPDPLPLDTAVIQALEQAIESGTTAPEAIGLGIIPWALLVEFAISALLRHLSK